MCSRLSFDLTCLKVFSTVFTALFVFLFFSTSRVSILLTALRFGWRAIVYVYGAFIWTLKKQLYPCGSCEVLFMQRLCCAVCREVNEFGKLFDRDAAQVQVVLRAIKVQENDSVSMVQYDTSCAYDFKPNTWKRHTSWLLIKARAAGIWSRTVEDHPAATATTAPGTFQIGQGDPQHYEY